MQNQSENQEGEEVIVKRLEGEEISEHLDAIFRLRISVFREFPYLYDGDMEYERNYLSNYATNPLSVLVVARDGDELVGCSTGMPLVDSDKAFVKPIKEAGYNPEKVYYFAESVLKEGYRGRGIGTRFFEEREAHVESIGTFDWIGFAAVDRREDHPLRPEDYHSHEEFWKRRGYKPYPELKARFKWKQITASPDEDSVDRFHTLSYWLKPVATTEP